MLHDDLHRQDRLRVAAWVLGALALVSGPLTAILDPSTDALLIAATGLVLMVPLVIRASQRAFDPFEPIFIFVVAYGVMFVLRPAAMLIREDVTFSIALQGVDIA